MIYGKELEVQKWVQDSYTLGKSYRRITDCQGGPDWFQAIPPNVSQDISPKNKKYYKIAFCNYWKRGVEKQLQAKLGKEPTEMQIQDEMLESVDTIMDIYEIIRVKGAPNNDDFGVNLKEELENGNLKGEYAKMFVDTFANGEQYRLDCFSKAIKRLELCVRKTTVTDANAGPLFGDMYIGEQGNIAVDSWQVANIKWFNMARELEKAKNNSAEKNNIYEAIELTL